jgi:hypothetical protein
VTVSPGCMNSCGSRPIPVPPHVPLLIRSPGRSVTVCVRTARSVGMEWIMVSVVVRCLYTPLTRVEISNGLAFGSGTSSAVMMCGPSGQNVSGHLHRVICSGSRSREATVDLVKQRKQFRVPAGKSIA